jgi:ribosomal protein S17E
MGKAISRNVRAKAEETMKLFPKEVGKDFEKNKLFIKSLNMPISKETVNLMAGYIARKSGAAE